MKLLIQKLTVLMTEIFPIGHFLSLSWNLATLSLSPPNKKKGLKIKIKLCIKMYYLQIQGTSYLITKKYERLK